jgi:hypothetical protein
MIERDDDSRKSHPALAHRFSGATLAEPRTEASTVLVDELGADGTDGAS